MQVIFFFFWHDPLYGHAQFCSLHTMYVILIGIFRAFSLFYKIKLNESINELTTGTAENLNEKNHEFPNIFFFFLSKTKEKARMEAKEKQMK